MIKARGVTKDGTPMVFLGLSGENVTRLVAGEPILVDFADLGLPATTTAIIYGRTERDAAMQLERLGLLPPGFSAKLPEPKPGVEVRIDPGERPTDERLLPHYFSTYCIHDDHEHCRLTCKTCAQPCRCACHSAG